MEKKRYYVLVGLFIIIILLSIFLYANLLEKISIIDSDELEAKVIVGDNYGFDVNGTALTFGMISAGKSTSTREILLENHYDVPVKVEIYVDGDISEFMIISENDFILNVDESKKLGFSVSVPYSTPNGNYSGIVKILYKSPVIK